MILQRLASAIRHQNWSQIITEILIVVIGIFLGLQVQAWYEEKGDRAQEKVYLERLHGEIENVQLSLQENQESYKNAFNVLAELSETISTKNRDIQLGANHCFYASMSHIYLNDSANAPTLLELISSGQLSLISNSLLRTSIAKYRMAEEIGQNSIAQLIPDKLELGKKYPSFITYDFGKIGSSSSIIDLTCDFKAIRESEEFKNDLLSNFRRNILFSNTQLNRLIIIEDIHSRIDQILEITHNETT